MKKLITIITILSFVVSCKITKLEITKPEEELNFLNIIKNFKSLDVSNEGKTVKIENETYNFQKDMGIFYGLYKKEKSDDSEYMILCCLLNTNNKAMLTTFNEDHKKALDEIINEIGNVGWAWAVSTIFSDEDYTAENISKNAKQGNINISKEKIDNIQKIIDDKTTVNTNNKRFGNFKTIP